MTMKCIQHTVLLNSNSPCIINCSYESQLKSMQKNKQILTSNIEDKEYTIFLTNRLSKSLKMESMQFEKK